MLMWPMGDDDSLDDIPDYDGHVDHLSQESKDEEYAESELWHPQEYPETPEEKINWQEQVHMLHLRSHLNKLLETLRHAQYITDKTREELKKCRYQIRQYEEEREKLCAEIETNEGEGNRPAVQRLQATLKRVNNELEAEQNLEAVIRDQLEQAEYELALAEVERGKFILAEDKLLQKEHQLSKDKVQMSMIRLQKEQLLAKNAVTSKKQEKRKIQDALNDAERRHIQAIEEAERSHERANKYLSKTLAKLKKRQQEEQDRYTSEMARKVDMLLKLKSDIASNRENLRAIWTRDTAAERHKQLVEKEEINKILAEGGNADEILLIKKRKNEVEKKKQQFEAEQKLKRTAIVQKILKEDESFKKRMELQPYLWTDPEQEKALRLCPVKKKPPKVLVDYIAACDDERVKGKTTDGGKQKESEIQRVEVASSDSYFTNVDYLKGLEILSIQMKQKSENMQQELDTNRNINKVNSEDEEMGNEVEDKNDLNLEDEAAFSDDEMEDVEEQEEEEAEEEHLEAEGQEPSLGHEVDLTEEEEVEELQVDLAKPEFEGLWGKQAVAYKAYKDADSAPAKPIGGSKMEQEILKKTLNKTREGITITQVAAGKEFSGCPFYSKPKIIHFKDFVVGKSYKKKVILTNVSYTVNYIRFMDITENMKNFIKISFEPPGQMSAGMTCEMTVTFKPEIDEDLNGEVHFLTQTGPFHVPLVCSTKKCDLSLNTTKIDFGTSVIGETLKKSFILTNRGALGASFTFYKVTGLKPQASRTETYLDEQFAEFLELSESHENALEDIRSVVLANQRDYKLMLDQDFDPDDANLVNGSNEIPAESVVETMPEVHSEEAKVAITNTSSPTAEPLVENISSKSDQVGDKKASFEADLDVVVSPTVVDHLSVIEDISETKVEAVQQSAHEMDKESEKVPTPILVPKEEEEVASLDGLKVGTLFTGNVGPFSSVVLEIIWHPTIPGEVRSEFAVTFSDLKIDALSIYAVANAIDVPVWIERQTVDLKICMFDRLYQDTVVINNRATIAQKLQFEVCKELRNHLELLPKTGYIQAHAQFSAQLKFLPRQSLFKEAAKFFDTETGVLEAPMIVHVGGQVTPVSFTVQAVVTTSDLEFGVCDIDFGCCTIHESVKQTLKLTNKSILPQQYGFVGLPECLEVQPNDGFGTLLPLETLELDVIFSPKAATEYKMNLRVRSLINRDFSIPCKGVGVLTPLELSQQVIRFRATPLYDTSSAAILVVNSHINANEFSHPVPRIGKGEICPVGPTSFEFKVPEDAPITISPRVGTVLSGQKLRVEVRFSPTLSSDYIKLEVMKMNVRQEEDKEEREREEAAKKGKQELENQRILIELKSKKGIKQTDSNLNNPKEADEITQDLSNYYKVYAFENEKVSFSNASNNRNQQRYDAFQIPATCFDKVCDVSICGSMAIKDSSVISDQPHSSKSCLEAENKSTPCRNETNKNILFSHPNVVRGSRHNEKTSSTIIGKNLNKMVDSRQDSKNSRKPSRNLPEGVSRSIIRKSIHPKQNSATKLQDRNHTGKQEKMVKSKNATDTNGETIFDENKNNNMLDNKEEDNENIQTSQGKRSNETIVGQKSGSKLSVNLLGTASGSSLNPVVGEFESGSSANIGKKKSTSSPKLSVTTIKSKQSSVQTVTEIDNDAAAKFDPDRISSDSPIYRTAIASLLKQFKGQFQSVTVPCYVASGVAGNPGELNFSIHNTLYLEVHCPSIRPPLIVISDEGRRTVDFGSVSVGQVCSKQVTIMNISEKEIKMKATALNPAGLFQIQNALRAVSPGATHTLLLTFTPDQDLLFQENLGINTLSSTLHLTLKGCGIRPLVKLSVQDGLFDMKAVQVGEFVEQPFMIENCSVLAVNYTIRLDSQSHLRHNKAQLLPPFLGAQYSYGTRNYVGPQNKSGRSVFDIVPFAGSVDAGETREIIVTFAPDHETDLFSDGVRVDLFGQESHFFQVTGQGKSQVMFLEGCDPLEPPMKSLAYFSKSGQDEELSGPPVQSALITIRSVMRGNYFEPGVRKIFIGCVRTMSPTQKKNGDFTVDGLQSLQQKGFTVQPQKGSVEPNSKAVIEITWIPPASYDPNNVVEETMNLTLKGDVTEQIPIVIRAMIVSE